MALLAQLPSALARRTGAAALNLLLPPHCPGCQTRLPDPHHLCATCFMHCHLIAPPLCRVCGVPFAHADQGGEGGICLACLGQTHAYRAARGAMAYQGLAKDLVLRFKHASETGLANFFAPLMRRAGAELLARATLIVAVPLHPTRLRARGYNQAVLLARAVARATTIPLVPDALVRTHATEKLRHTSAADRADIMANAIAVRPSLARRLAGQNVLVIDDVMTSGATLTACANALRNAGAANIDGLVAARVPAPELQTPKSGFAVERIAK